MPSLEIPRGSFKNVRTAGLRRKSAVHAEINTSGRTLQKLFRNINNVNNLLSKVLPSDEAATGCSTPKQLEESIDSTWKKCKIRLQKLQSHSTPSPGSFPSVEDYAYESGSSYQILQAPDGQVFLAPAIPLSEVDRLYYLDDLDILDTEGDPVFNRFVKTVSSLLDFPIVLVSLIDQNRQVFVGNVGLPGVKETPRAVSFCGHCILRPEALLEIPDAASDFRFKGNPLVTGDPNIRYYCGAPLVSEGIPLGTLCCIDRKPRKLSEEQRQILENFRDILVREFSLRRALRAAKMQTELTQNLLENIIPPMYLEKLKAMVERSEASRGRRMSESQYLFSRESTKELRERSLSFHVESSDGSDDQATPSLGTFQDAGTTITEVPTGDAAVFDVKAHSLANGRSRATSIGPQKLVLAESCPMCTVVFFDLVNFTTFCSSVSAEKVVDVLGSLFAEFDSLLEAFGLTKVKTLGDGYLAVCGLFEGEQDHALRVVDMALSLLSGMSDINKLCGTNFGLRCGINSGPVVAGIVGRMKFNFDIFGDTVNVAARMEHLGDPGKAHITEHTYNLIISARKESYIFENRDPIFVKGKGMMNTYFVSLADGH